MSDDLVDEIAYLVWKEGHYSSQWEQWNKDRWRSVARAILQTVERHLQERANVVANHE